MAKKKMNEAAARKRAEKTLEESRQNLQQYSVKLEKMNDKLRESLNKVAEKDQKMYDLNQRLLVANKKLRELDRMKSNFVANVSHELKNPLTNIKDALSIIVEGTAGEVNKEQERFVAIAARNTDRLYRLVVDILTLSRIEAGKVEPRIEDVDLAVLLEDVIEDFTRELARKELTLDKNIQHDLGTVPADEDKITEVIINLLTNAIKYTPVRGLITVKLTGTREEVCCEIADNGPGISKENQKKIFDKFERITAEKQEGAGLGLPIARELVHLHQGKMWVVSFPGKGSRFVFTLPR